MLDLDAIKALCDAATPGPWERYAGSPKTRYIVAPNVEHIDVDEADWGPEVGNVLAVGTLNDPRAWRYADVEFIAQARTLVPALVTEVEALRAAVDRAGALVDAAQLALSYHQEPHVVAAVMAARDAYLAAVGAEDEEQGYEDWPAIRGYVDEEDGDE